MSSRNSLFLRLEIYSVDEDGNQIEGLSGLEFTDDVSYVSEDFSGLSFGATLLYIFANYFLKETIEEKFSKKFINLTDKFKKNEFIFFLIYRNIPGIPFFISNILPTLFNIKIKNFFFGTLIGMTPQLFIGVSLGAGLNKVLEENKNPPSFFDLIFTPDVYFPIVGLVIIVLLGITLKKKFLLNN